MDHSYNSMYQNMHIVNSARSLPHTDVLRSRTDALSAVNEAGSCVAGDVNVLCVSMDVHFAPRGGSVDSVQHGVRPRVVVEVLGLPS